MTHYWFVTSTKNRPFKTIGYHALQGICLIATQNFPIIQQGKQAAVWGAGGSKSFGISPICYQGVELRRAYGKVEVDSTNDLH